MSISSRMPLIGVNRIQWIESISKHQSDYSSIDTVCGLHFSKDDFVELEGKRTLKKNSIPSIFGVAADTKWNDSIPIIVEPDISIKIEPDPLESSYFTPEMNQLPQEACGGCLDLQIQLSIAQKKILELQGTCQELRRNLMEKEKFKK